MREVILFLFISALSIHNIHGQELIPIFSDEVVVPPKEFLVDLVQKGNDKMVFVTESLIAGERKNHICTYRPNKKLQRNELVTPLKNAFGFKFFSLEDRIYRWYMAKHKESKSILRSIVEFDLNGDKVAVKSMPPIKYHDYNDQPTQNLYYSPDSSKVLAVEVVDENHKKDPIRISLIVLKKDLETSHDRVFQGKEKSQRTTDHCVARINNSGEAYLLQKVFPGGKVDRIVINKKIPNYYYELIRVTANGKTKAFRIKDLKEFSNVQNLYLTSEGKPMVITGINESSKENAALIGFHCHVFNEKTNSFDKKKITFSRRLRGWGISKEMDYKKLFDFFDFDPDYLVEEGKIHFLLERSYFEIKGEGRKGAYTANVKKAALVFTISNEGKVIDNMYVPKVIDTRANIKSSKLFLAKGKLHLLYSLNEKFRNGALDEPMFYEGNRDHIGSNSIISIATKENRKMKKWNIKASDNLLLHAFGVYNNDEKLFIPFIDYSLKKKASLGLLTQAIPE